MRGKYCKHIEKKLPKQSKRSIKAYSTDRIEDYGLQADFGRKYKNAEDVERGLIKFGLDPYEVELLMLRFIEELSMKEIVKKQGWLNSGSAGYFLKRALKKLRDGSFKL